MEFSSGPGRQECWKVVPLSRQIERYYHHDEAALGELDGKVAIVTGVGRLRGLGRSTAQSLPSLGCDVVVTDTWRDPSTFPPDERDTGWQGVHSGAYMVRAQGRLSLSLVVDVTDSLAVRSMVDTTVHHMGRVDIFINNVVYTRGPDRVPLTELDEEVFRQVMEIKVTGTYLCCKTVIPQMIQQGEGDKIVSLSSIMGKGAQPNNTVYGTANGAIHVLTAALALKVSQYQINVNAVCPGTLNTAHNDILTSEQWERTMAQIPMGRLGTAEEVSDFMAYLCTPAAPWIQGQSLNINGGQVKRPTKGKLCALP